MNQLKQIYTWTEKNPSNQFTINTQKTEVQTTETNLWNGCQKKILPLPGALSGYLYCMDTMFQESSPNLQIQILREKILELQERVPTQLLGRKWPRKKIVELLSGELAEKAPTTEKALEESLCELLSVQKIQISLKEKSILFFPSDLRNWKRDRPVFLFDTDNLWTYENPSIRMGKSLHDWLISREEERWSIAWPLADGKLEELKVALEKRNLIAHSKIIGEKVKKDDYSRIVGRAEAITVLCS